MFARLSPHRTLSVLILFTVCLLSTMVINLRPASAERLTLNGCQIEATRRTIRGVDWLVGNTPVPLRVDLVLSNNAPFPVPYYMEFFDFETGAIITRQDFNLPAAPTDVPVSITFTAKPYYSVGLGQLMNGTHYYDGLNPNVGYLSNPGITTTITSCPTSAPGQTANPQSVNSVIAAEQARGITRAFDDVIVIARQPNGDYQYYRYDGCFIGSTSSETIRNLEFSAEYYLGSVEGCDGYRVELRSLGYPECQFQMNMYGPNGFERVYTGPVSSNCSPLGYVETPLWRQFLGVAGDIGRQVGMGTAELVAQIKGWGPAWSSLLGSWQMYNVGRVADQFDTPDDRARMIDEAYNGSDRFPTFRTRVDEGVDIGCMLIGCSASTWNELTPEQKRDDLMWTSVCASLGQGWCTNFVGPEFLTRWLESNP